MASDADITLCRVTNPKLLVVVIFCVLQAPLVCVADTTKLSYDALGRLVRYGTIGAPNEGLSMTTGFDPAGNRGNYTVVRDGNIGGMGSSVSINVGFANEGKSADLIVSRASSCSGSFTINLRRRQIQHPIRVIIPTSQARSPLRRRHPRRSSFRLICLTMASSSQPKHSSSI